MQLTTDKTELFAIQDGGDFYLFTDPECCDFLGSVSYGRVRDSHLNLAKLFRRELRLDLYAWGIQLNFN